MSPMAPKKRIAVLGGGCGALAAVFALTDRDPQVYDITVYQPGWRLGGKGASGRNAEQGQRIEEHGLHVWSGFYENAFSMMRKCYAELARAATLPMAVAQGGQRLGVAFAPLMLAQVHLTPAPATELAHRIATARELGLLAPARTGGHGESELAFAQAITRDVIHDMLPPSQWTCRVLWPQGSAIHRYRPRLACFRPSI